MITAPPTPALFDAQAFERLKEIAARRGYGQHIAYYLSQLIDQDAAEHGEDLPELVDTPEAYILEGIKQGLLEALRGETKPIAELWKEFNDE